MINSLQSLRGIFAIFIFLHHYEINGKSIFDAGGPCGVAFFLILSGFVMCAGYEKKAERTKFEFSRYYLKRIIRLYPLHFLCLTIVFGLNLLHLTIQKILILIPNLLLLQSWVPVKAIYFSGNAVSWCLSDLMFFYAVFPFLIQFIHKYRKAFWYTLCSVLIIYFSCIHIIPTRFQHAIIYINPLFRLIDFTLGVGLWQIWSIHRDKIMIKRVANCSIIRSSFLEVSAVGILVVAILIYPHCRSSINLASLWWLPSIFTIYIFTLFNKRGGGINKNYKFKTSCLFWRL